MIHLIIDASVARSCNDPSDNIEAQSTYLFLQHVGKRENATGVVVNEEIEREWDIHANRTFTRWLARMETRKRVHHVEVKRSKDYRAVVSSVSNSGIKAALEKDLHLIELALFGHNPIVSRDDKQRVYVRALIDEYSVLGAIQWVNPVSESGWEEWLGRGCEQGTFALAAS